ncbi:sensor histidine kinase [Cohnella sp. GCM10027633]|uniref:cache domain-containing sensor histidine kinase n=1 Tax=unclassified Cohnella TaxID=2636738 RepID=UPI0036406737
MWPKIAKFNSLRNQMLFGFLLVMLVILTFVGAITYDSVSTMLKNNTAKHIQQTAVEANGRLEGILEQVDSLTTLVATNDYVQRLLLLEGEGRTATFSERQALPPLINTIQLYASGVKSVELYTNDRRRLFPLDEARLDEKVSEDWIRKTIEGQGGIVWFGIDPADRNTLIAIRQVSLIERNFATGGYLLVRMDRNVFAFDDPSAGERERETMLLVGADGKLLASNAEAVTDEDASLLTASDRQSATLRDRHYVMVKQRSAMTGWTLVILTPVHAITDGVSVLRATIVASAGIGTALFALLSLLLSTIITRPILKLIKTMRGARMGLPKPTELVSSTIEINELNHTYNNMIDNINELIRLVYEKELLQSRTELKALQAQINPHFLYNTLEALYWSLQEKDEEELAEFVVAMSDLFRYTISGPTRSEWVTLQDELDHIEKYLRIMKLRFGDRLSWAIDCPPAFGSAKLPRLLLQPFVENAVLHGVESKLGPGTVSLSVESSDDGERLYVTVEDDGAGMDEESLRMLEEALRDERDRLPASTGSGLGALNAARRIRLCYGDAPGPERLTVRSVKGRGTSIRITIPIPMAGGTDETQVDLDRGR